MSGVEAVLADVNNTPWGESHAYVIGSGGPKRVISGRLEKEFHVSPLMGMDHVYEWRTTAPGDDLQVHIASHAGRRAHLRRDALAAAPRADARDRPADAARYPAITAQVVAKIYWQALRLRLKGAPWHPHPERS